MRGGGVPEEGRVFPHEKAGSFNERAPCTRGTMAPPLSEGPLLRRGGVVHRVKNGSLSLRKTALSMRGRVAPEGEWGLLFEEGVPTGGRPGRGLRARMGRRASTAAPRIGRHPCSLACSGGAHNPARSSSARL